jgi:hypothetical protein
MVFSKYAILAVSEKTFRGSLLMFGKLYWLIFWRSLLSPQNPHKASLLKGFGA